MCKENKPPVNESLIWHNFRNGSEKAYEQIYDTHFGPLYNYGLHICQNKDLIKDCIQNLFFELWKNKENLSEVHNIKSYLFTCIRRKIIEELKKEDKYASHEISDSYNFRINTSYESDLIDEQQNENISKRLSTSINSLTKRQKEAVFLKFYENMEYHEIATIMSFKSAKYARTIIYRALDVLKLSITKEIIY